MNNLRTSPLSSCKNLPRYFFMVHLLHRLYGVDAPAAEYRPWDRDHPLGNACGLGYRHSALSEQLGAAGWATDRCDDVAALSIPIALNRPTMQ